MLDTEKNDFLDLLSDVYAYYRQDLGRFAMQVFWDACKRFDFEQVSQALSRHATDPDVGQFAPKVADIVRVLAGTSTDRAKLAWGKVYAAMGEVGAYQDVCFDDGLIHLVVEDMGGWVKMCRTESKDLSFAQHQFCEAYRAYAGRGQVAYPKYLSGVNGTGQNHAMLLKRGIKPPEPMFIGNQTACKAVILNGTNEARGVLSITAKPIQTLVSTSIQGVSGRLSA